MNPATPPNGPLLRIVTATRLSMERFQRESLLFPSLRRIGAQSPVRLTVKQENTMPLALVYNRAIEKAHDDEILVFVHDDISIDDWLFPRRIAEALDHFDVVGLVGNRRRVPRQPKWFIAEYGSSRFDMEYLSGAIAHLEGNGEAPVSDYGPSPARVRLVDGALIASRASVLRQSGVRFDERFSFDFYDLDFCRSCEAADLKIGTWPIAATHKSGGKFNTPPWEAAYRVYLDKWKE